MPLSLQLFLDAFLSGLALPLRADAAFFALKSFGQLSFMAFALAVAGRVSVHALHWALGRYARHMRDRGVIHVRLTGRVERIAPRVIAFALLFTWVSAGAVWPLAAGFFKLKLRYALPLIALGQAGYYLYSAYL